MLKIISQPDQFKKTPDIIMPGVHINITSHPRSFLTGLSGFCPVQQRR